MAKVRQLTLEYRFIPKVVLNQALQMGDAVEIDMLTVNADQLDTLVDDMPLHHNRDITVF